MRGMVGVALAAIAMGAACGDGAGSPADAAPDAGTPDAGAPDAVTEVRITGLVSELIDRTPVADVTVTLVDHPEVAAVLSDADGKFVLEGVPPNGDRIVHFDKEGFVPSVTRVLEVGAEDYAIGDDTTLFLTTTATSDVMASIVGVELDPGKGMIAMVLYGSISAGPLEGATATITPNSGTGAVYLNSVGFPDLSLEASSTSGTVVFANTDPGNIDLTIEHPLLPTCFAIGADEQYPVRLVVYAGTMSLAGAIVCTE